MSFKEFLSEGKDLTWDGIKRYGVNISKTHPWTKMSKAEIVDYIITELSKHLDKQVLKNLDMKVLKDILESEKDVYKLYGLMNIISFRNDFSAKSPYGNYQTMLLQMVAQYKRDKGTGSMYESEEASSGGFKEFLSESSECCEYDEETTDLKMQIEIELSELSDEELDEFGSVLHGEFFDEDDGFEDDVYTREDIDVMIAELGEEFFEDILDMLEEIEDEEMDEEMDEAVSRRMKSQNRNRKKRKFMQTSRAELRRTKQKRKIQARKTKQARKRYYRANKNKIKNYQKSRAEAIKKGTHKVKVRRKA